MTLYLENIFFGYLLIGYLNLRDIRNMTFSFLNNSYKYSDREYAT